jgi:hypothetical protein
MMLDYLGEKSAAQRVEDAVVRLLRSRKLPNLGMDSGFATNQVGDLVLAELEGAGAGASRALTRSPAYSPPGSSWSVMRSSQR